MKISWIFLLFAGIACSAQQKTYTTAHAHSHNDYEQAMPFQDAWQHGFGSIEADIWLRGGRLIVAHDSAGLSRQWTLDSLYLLPLQLGIEKNNGWVYADKTRSLQLMIDIKSEATATLDKLVETLKTYPVLIHCASLKILISGNRPAPAHFSSYPSWIYFDGELNKAYQPDELKKIEMLSDNFARYSRWKGVGAIPEKDSIVLQHLIDKTHRLGKKIRFWNAPDNENAWQTFMRLGVDFINTDKIAELSGFLAK